TDNNEIIMAIIHTPVRRHECRILTRSFWCRCDTAGRTFRSVKIVEMAQANPIICPDCGVPMNHHANKVRKETHAEDVSAFDIGLGGVIEEFHTCPQCGKTQSRRAPHSETS